MNKQNFLQAIEIIAMHHTTKMVINKPVNGSIGNLCTSEFTIHITDCCASVINKLKEAGYSLSMNDGALSVWKIL